jgi:hypothetical protein
MAVQSEETLYLAEQRRFRRLEVSLPVWLAVEEDFNRPGSTPWSLGYTRDLSMGGSKVFVPSQEEAKWRDVCGRGVLCLLRFDATGVGAEEYITGRVKHAAREKESGNFWLGVEYEEGSTEARSAAVKAGLQTVKSRRRWQGLTALAFIVIALGAVAVSQLNSKNAEVRAENTRLVRHQQELNEQLSGLSQPGRHIASRAMPAACTTANKSGSPLPNSSKSAATCASSPTSARRKRQPVALCNSAARSLSRA